MKITKLLSMGAVACVMVSCQNNGGDLSSSSTPADSLMYYLGQVQAMDYIQQAQRDTLMKEVMMREAYLSGLRDGLNSFKEGDEHYNQGVMAGMQMASQVYEYCKQMDVTMEKSFYLNSYANTLNLVFDKDSTIDMRNAQMEIRRLMQDIEKQKIEKDEAEARESLKTAAEKDGYKKITDDLYGKIKEEKGESLKNDDDVTLDVKITQLDGKDVMYSIPGKGKVGRRPIPQLVSDALLKMKSGETGEFMTTAQALLGQGAQRYDLKGTDLLKITIKATLEQKEEPKEEAADTKK